MKKQLIITPALAIILMGSLLAADAHAWPWGKKDKDAESAPAAEQAVGPMAPPSKKQRKMPQFSVNTTSPSAPQSATGAPEAPQVRVPVAESNPLVPKVQVKSPLSDEVNELKVEDPVESLDAPIDKTFVAVDDPTNPLGVTVSAEKLNAAAQLIAQKKYVEAGKSLNTLKDWLVDATEAHINLHKTLKGVPSAQVQAELEKQLALQFALLRDKAFLQLGMLGIAQSDYSAAVKNLSRVIQSQPRSPMGAQAYEILQKIGFTEKIQLREERKDVGAATP